MEFQDLGVTITDKVAVVEIQRPPNNFFNTGLINDLADLRASLEAALDDAKSLLRAQLDTSLVTLAQQIEATLILLPR